MMFAQAPRSRLPPVTVPSGPVKVGATRGRDGRIRVVAINKDAGSAYEVSLATPGASGASLE